MKKILLALFVVIMGAVLIFSGCSTEESPTSQTTASPTTTKPVQTVTIKFGYDIPPHTSLGDPVDAFAKEVNEKTGGRVKVETYPAGTLSTMESALESLRAGVADAYVISIGANQNAFPVINFTSLPGLDCFPHTEELLEAETNALRTVINKYPSAAEDLEGFKMLYSNTYTSAILMGNGDPIRKPADMQGKKIGCTGFRQELTVNLDAAPVFTIPPQMYEQLQNGVCDAVYVAWNAAGDWQLQEQTDYAYDQTFGGDQLPAVMRMEVWNKLSPQDQQIVTEAAAMAEQVNRDFITNQIPGVRQLWADSGIDVISPTAEEKALWEKEFAVVWQNYIDTNKAAGVSDIEAIFNEWKTLVETARGF
jgi:TRAP-type C4-dicarboxylate transport system substrate-binding protein